MQLGPSAKPIWISTLVGLSCVLCVGILASILDQKRNALDRAEQLAYLPKGQYLKLAVLGYRQIMADLIWFQAVQHIGSKKDTPRGYLWTYHAVDVLTDLDPNFVPPYQATGVFLGVLVGLHEEAIAILEKGMHHNPKIWQLPFLAGYISYYELCDPLAAGRYLSMAAQLPGAPSYLPRLASRMTVQGGDLAAALEFLDRFSRNVDDARVREALATRMKEIAQERDLRALEDSVERYYNRYHRFPTKPDDLLISGSIQQLPADPLGGEYQVNFMTGSVSASSRPERLRIHERFSCQKGAGKLQSQAGLSARDIATN